jgi:hypothetical protein
LGAGVEIEFRVSGSTRFAEGTPGIGNCSFIGHKERPLKRLVLGVTEAFGALLRLGGIMIPGRGFWMFLEGFRAGGFGALFSGNGLWLRRLRDEQLWVMDFKPAQGGGVAREGSGSASVAGVMGS